MVQVTNQIELDYFLFSHQSAVLKQARQLKVHWPESVIKRLAFAGIKEKLHVKFKHTADTLKITSEQIYQKMVS